MTADPVTAAVLAEALREGIRELKWIAGQCPMCDGNGEFWSEGQDCQVSCPQCNGSGVRGPLPSRWQGILDRYDAQCRDEILAILSDRDLYMRLARTERGGDWPLWYSTRARELNHDAIRLRRQLRALEAKP